MHQNLWVCAKTNKCHITMYLRFVLRYTNGHLVWIRDENKRIRFYFISCGLQKMMVIKFTIDTYIICLELTPKLTDKLTWSLNCFSDSDWGGDKVNQRSINGWTIMFNGSLIRWGSKQKMIFWTIWLSTPRPATCGGITSSVRSPVTGTMYRSMSSP